MFPINLFWKPFPNGSCQVVKVRKQILPIRTDGYPQLIGWQTFFIPGGIPGDTLEQHPEASTGAKCEPLRRELHCLPGCLWAHFEVLILTLKALYDMGPGGAASLGCHLLVPSDLARERCCRAHLSGKHSWQAQGGRPSLPWHLPSGTFPSPRNEVSSLPIYFLEVLQDLAVSSGQGLSGHW